MFFSLRKFQIFSERSLHFLLIANVEKLSVIIFIEKCFTVILQKAIKKIVFLCFAVTKIEELDHLNQKNVDAFS